MPSWYSLSKRTIYLNPSEVYYFNVITTPINNIRTETILKPVVDTNYTGINGGFYQSDNGYQNPPTRGSSIAWHIDDIGEVAPGNSSLYKNHIYNEGAADQTLRKTMYLYTDVGGNIQADWMYARNRDEVLNNTSGVRQIIGGNDYNSESWGGPISGYNASLHRTALAWDSTNAYLIVSTTSLTIPKLKESLEQMQYNPVNSIVLDGSGSSSMNVTTDSSYNVPNDERYVFNMIRLARDF